jgi:hypothetical protein
LKAAKSIFNIQSPQRARLGRCRSWNAIICPISKLFIKYPFLNSPPFSRLVSPGCRVYPTGSGKAFIRRSMLPDKCRVRRLSASNNSSSEHA